MGNLLIVNVNFTRDEAEFLASLLARWNEAAPVNTAEKFWVERLYNRVHQEMVDVVASDAAARLAISAQSPGFGMPPPPPPIPAPMPAALCSCGSVPSSPRCNTLRTQGKHP
jgi:hypothetical protein